MPRIILGLGSNMGDRAKNLQAAIKAIAAFGGEVTGSTILESKALLPEGAPVDWDMVFLNMAVLLETDMPPEELLSQLKQIEEAIGRKKRSTWAPREIDIDILAYGETYLELPNLTIPHPHLLARDFALLPLVELWPDWRCPVPGKYEGWAARNIAVNKNYGLSDALYKAKVLYG